MYLFYSAGPITRTDGIALILVYLSMINYHEVLKKFLKIKSVFEGMLPRPKDVVTIFFTFGIEHKSYAVWRGETSSLFVRSFESPVNSSSCIRYGFA